MRMAADNTFEDMIRAIVREEMLLNGVAPKLDSKRSHKLSADDKRAIALRYIKGETGHQLAKHFKVSTPTIYKHLDALGVQLRPRGRRPSV